MTFTDPPIVDQPTRARLLAMLRFSARTVDELAAATGLTPNAIRSQLAGLGRDGLVRRQGVRRRTAAGKPPVLYSLTDLAETQFSRAYVPALTAIAETLASRLPTAELRELFGAAGERLAATIDAPANAPAPDLAISLLESLGGAATVRTGDGRTVLEGAACPLASAVRACPESCELVRSLLAQVTGVPVATQCQHGAEPKCRFELG